MKTPTQQEFEQVVNETEHAYQKAGALQKLGINLKGFWVQLQLRFPILLPCLLGGLLVGLITALLEGAYPGLVAQSWVYMVIIILVVFIVVVWPLAKRNLEFAEFVRQCQDEEKRVT